MGAAGFRRFPAAPVAGGEGPGVEELEEVGNYLGVASVERGTAEGGLAAGADGRRLCYTAAWLLRRGNGGAEGSVSCATARGSSLRG